MGRKESPMKTLGKVVAYVAAIGAGPLVLVSMLYVLCTTSWGLYADVGALIVLAIAWRKLDASEKRRYERNVLDAHECIVCEKRGGKSVIPATKNYCPTCGTTFTNNELATMKLYYTPLKQETGILSPSGAKFTYNVLSEPNTSPYSLPPLDQEVAYIMGTPNFTCGPLAEGLRRKGHNIGRKAEAEQAYVIHWMLSLYCKYGATKWHEEGGKILGLNNNSPEGQKEVQDAKTA
jgi:hypothetical protein